jgi:hypothetical protein
MSFLRASHANPTAHSRESGNPGFWVTQRIRTEHVIAPTHLRSGQTWVPAFAGMTGCEGRA